MKEPSKKKIKTAFISCVLMALILLIAYLVAMLFIALPDIGAAIVCAIIIIASWIYLYRSLYKM